MTIVDSLFDQMGGLRLPVTPGQVGADLTVQSLDPGLDVLLDLFQAAINSEFGPLWKKITDSLPAGATGKPHYLRGSLPVQDVLPIPPSGDTMEQRAAGWPLLTLHRTEATWDQYTLSNDRLTQTWEMNYIVGPLDVGEHRKLAAICQAVQKTVGLVIQEGGHRAYRDGELQFFGDRAAFSRIVLSAVEGTGPAKFASSDSSPLYYATTMRLETWEVSSNDLSGYGSASGLTADVGVGGTDGTVRGLMYLDSESGV